MAGPLSGIAGQPQVPLSQSNSASQNNDQVRDRQDARAQTQTDRVQPQNAPAAQSQGSNNARSQEQLDRKLEDLLVAQSRNGDDSPTIRRGSLIDLSV